MSDPSLSFFEELKRRNVFRVGLAYVVSAWILAQVADLALEAFGAPAWVLKSLLVLLLFGFPVALIFAWAFEKTPEGIKLEKNVDRSQSMTPVTGKKLDKGIIVALAIAVVFLLYREATAPDRGATEQASDMQQATAHAGGSSSADNPEATPTLGEKSIAVLPFANMSEDESNAYFASGVQEDILTYLSKVADLRVISRTSVLQYAGFKGDVRQVARELGVSHILEGSVRRSGNRVRVTAQLIDARDDEHVWAENYDRDLTDVFAIQTEVAKKIVKALQASLSPQEAKLIEARPTRNVEAYDAYLQARDQIHRPEYSAEKFFRALPLAQKAVELDPDFALAYLQLADIYGQLYWLAAYDEAYIAEARNALDQAQRLSPDMPEIRVSMGEFYYRMESDFPKALKEFELAQLQMPNNGNLLMRLGFTQRRVGLWDESIASFRRGITLDPANNYLVSGLAETLYNAGRWREAVAVLQQETSKNPEYLVFRVNEAFYRLLGDGDLAFARQVLGSIAPVNDQGYGFLAILTPWWSRDFQGAVDAWNGTRSVDDTFYKYYGLNALGKIYRAMGNLAQAEKYFQLAIQTTRDEQERGGIDSYAYHQVRGIALAYLGESEAALKEIDQAVAMRSESADRLEGPTVSIVRAEVWMMAGKTDEAISEIERLLKYPIATTPAGLRLDPTWDPLRENPRFKALLAKVADQ
ncbi:MAG: hypothetical protein MUP90_02700 [Gammaproteobacteria bacterium]|nr:hypothetical protein [Gammaproteobacteria bacterium]